MIRINQLKLSMDQKEDCLASKVTKALKIKEEQLISYRIVKKSIDARKKPELFWVYSVDVQVAQEDKIMKKVNDKNIMLTKPKKYQILSADFAEEHTKRPVVIGAGPAGRVGSLELGKLNEDTILIENRKEETIVPIAQTQVGNLTFGA